MLVFQQPGGLPGEHRVPLEQLKLQLPPEHTRVPEDPDAGPGHALPQLPQLSTLLLRLRHRLPHLVKPELQLNPHWPPEQAGVPFCGAVQPLLHAPQRAIVFCTFTQSPPQFVKPPLQVNPHAPPEHEGEALGLVVVQVLPQLPQFETSLFRL